MKLNTQKLLVWLYAPEVEKRRLIDYQELKLLLPDMTNGGRRSLIHYLTQKLLVRTERMRELTYISLTSHGINALVAQFPAFDVARQQWQGEWSVLVFRSGPKGDPHFRYLRQLLLDNHALSLSRGVYLYPGELSSRVIDVCKKMYVGAVIVFTTHQWTFGDERRIINQHYLLSDLVEIYSGVSKEINQLLELKSNQKRLTKKSRLEIYSVFNRFFNVLNTDPGFLHYYYPQTPSALMLLNQLHSITNDDL